ncbi:TraB/GumN family protein [Paenibacillus pinihumi]|uniref:TraB/GumN family protein n=1 Tax=Paenibacillus pinihumi TaxID=669462 RepID=UPI0004165048|nr:TraB/GumN family protein [Paenibacillus pinihumi]
MTKIDPQAAQKLAAELGIYNDGTKLQDHISAGTYKKITEFLKANGMPENSFDIFKPWIVQQPLMPCSG